MNMNPGMAKLATKPNNEVRKVQHMLIIDFPLQDRDDPTVPEHVKTFSLPASTSCLSIYPLSSFAIFRQD
jgi:hypothetical protein